MNRDDVIRMAREAGLMGNPLAYADWYPEALERFAALVAAAERDRMCEQFNIQKELAHEKAKSNEADGAAVLGKS